MTFHVAPALITCSSSPTAPGVSAPGGSFPDELSRLQHEYRVARGGEKGPALRRLQNCVHQQMAKELR